MSNAINNNQVSVINDSDFLMFREFAQNNEENMRVQLGQGGERRLIQADRKANVIERAFNLTEKAQAARAANDEVRTALLQSVLRVCGASDFSELDPTIQAQFSGTQEHYTGVGSDMALQGEGVHAYATSGRPLSVRRITAIVNATTAYIDGKNRIISKQNDMDRDFGILLKSEDPESPSLPKFDLANQDTPAIRSHLNNVYGYFRTLMDNNHKYDDGQVRSMLVNCISLLFDAVRNSLKETEHDENEKAGIMRRFKKAVIDMLRDLNAEEETRVCADAVVVELENDFEDIGKNWRPDNAAAS